jgi:prepilin-type N-terminal cleavage/methylation domain-containing protein
MKRRGFSIIELLVVMVIIGIIVRIAVPRYAVARKQAIARAVIGDVRVLRDAALNYQTDRGAWPPETRGGRTPAGLAKYLPKGFEFRRASYTLDYDSWINPRGRLRRNAPAIVAIGVTTPDRQLRAAIRQLGATGIPYFTSGNKTTFILTGLD